jgi:hypothetical protein
VFWIAIYGTVFLWVIFALSSIFSLSLRWLLVVAIALSLNIANVVGYTKCQKGNLHFQGFFVLSLIMRCVCAVPDARQRVSSYAASFILGNVLRQAAAPAAPAPAPAAGSINL